MTARAESLRTNWSLPPYLVWASVWYAFFLFAVNVRVGSMLWEPVYLWVFAQVRLLEPMTGDLGRRAALGLMFAAYLLLGSVLWVALESRSRTGSQNIWRRSGIAWAAVVVSTMLVSFILLKWT
jgi:hypothetical protein